MFSIVLSVFSCRRLERSVLWRTYRQRKLLQSRQVPAVRPWRFRRLIQRIAAQSSFKISYKWTLAVTVRPYGCQAVGWGSSRREFLNCAFLYWKRAIDYSIGLSVRRVFSTLRNKIQDSACMCWHRCRTDCSSIFDVIAGQCCRLTAMSIGFKTNELFLCRNISYVLITYYCILCTIYCLRWWHTFIEFSWRL